MGNHFFFGMFSYLESHLRYGCREEIVLPAQNHNIWEIFHRLRDETNLIWWYCPYK